MADASSAEAPQKRNIAEEILDGGKKAFDPANDSSTQATGRQEYDNLIDESVFLFYTQITNSVLTYSAERIHGLFYML